MSQVSAVAKYSSGMSDSVFGRPGSSKYATPSAGKPRLVSPASGKAGGRPPLDPPMTRTAPRPVLVSLGSQNRPTNPLAASDCELFTIAMPVNLR